MKIMKTFINSWEFVMEVNSKDYQISFYILAAFHVAFEFELIFKGSNVSHGPHAFYCWRK